MNTDQYRCIVFDWDGTLIDSIARIVASLKVAGRQVCGIEITDQSARDVIGMGLQEALARLLPGESDEIHLAAAEAYKRDFIVDNKVPSPLFEGVLEMLDDLKTRGFTLAIATGKSRLGLDNAIAEHDIEHLFTTTRCAGEYPSKPDPEMLLSIMRETGFAAEQTLMIGDSEHDMRMAANAGVGAVAVPHGAHDAEVLLQHQPLMCLQHIAEISDVLSHNCLTS